MVLVDYGSLVVHVFSGPPGHYGLESLWGDAPAWIFRTEG